MNLTRSSSTCGACNKMITTEASFCPSCGFNIKPIGTAEYAAITEEMAPSSVESPVLLDRIKLVEGRSAGGWIKVFRDPGSRPGAEQSEVIDLTHPKAAVEPEQIYPLTRRTRGTPKETWQAPPTAAEPEAGSRGGKRFPAKVKVGYATEHNFYTGFLENLGSGGIFVSTHAPSDIDEVLEVTFSVPGLSRCASAVCQVQWVREYDADLPDMIPGMGLRFIKLGAEARAAVELFIRHREPIFFTD